MVDWRRRRWIRDARPRRCCSRRGRASRYSERGIVGAEPGSLKGPRGRRAAGHRRRKIVSRAAAAYIPPDPEREGTLGDTFDLSGLLDEYRDEARGQLDLLDAALLTLEREGALPDEERAVLLRALHTLKGNSGMLGLTVVRDRVHAIESVFRDPPHEWAQPVLDGLFAGAAALRRAIDAAGTGDGRAELERLAALPPADSLVAASRGTPSPPAPAAPRTEQPSTGVAEPSPDASREDAGMSSPDERDEVSTEARGPIELLRVPFPKLDALVNLVAELIGVHAALDDLQTANRAALRAAGLRRPLQTQVEQLERIATELRDAAFELRLVPVRRVFARFPSLVRDLARAQGKLVRVELEGDETELDKVTVDILAEPLLHLVRNAVDHGIEPPDVREARGKPREGRITLRALQSGDRVRIEVADDGRGLDHERILVHARQVGLVAAGETLTDEEVSELIFRPGFSTRLRADTVSGRGIGLDVVASSVARLRGRLSVEEEAGRETRFLMHLPLTLAIVPALLFEAAGETLALPALEVEEAMRPGPLSWVAGAEVVAYGDELIPLARPDRLFGWEAQENGAVPQDRTADSPSTDAPGEPPVAAPPRFVVVVRRGTRAAAVAADRMLEQRDVVIKALPAYLGQPRGVSGATIAPDGRVIWLLDAGAVIELNFDTYRRLGHVAQAGEDPRR